MQTVIESEHLSVTIQHLGAEMSSVKNKEGLEFIWQAKKEVWPRHAPVLFPIVGKLKDNKYRYGERSYELGQHGFARDLIFALVQRDQGSCTFKLLATQDTVKKFPFDFSFCISYKLEGNSLSTEYHVSNTSNTEMYFGVGAHPGFNCPLLPTEQFEDYYIEFEKSSLEITPLNNGLRLAEKNPLHLEHKKLPLTKMTFDNDALVFENGQIDKVILRSNASTHEVTLTCKGWPYFGIWSKKSCTEFVCLEPWYGIADKDSSTGELTDKDGMIKLMAGKDFKASFTTSFV